MSARVLALLALLIAAGGTTYILLTGRGGGGTIRFVNSAKMIEAYKGTAAARAAFKEKTGAWKANVDTLEQELEAALKKYEREKAGMTDKERELSMSLLRNQREQYYRYQQNTDQRIKEESDRMSTALVGEIDALVKDHARRKGYSVVLGATGDGTLVFADDALDITDEMIQVINAAP